MAERLPLREPDASFLRVGLQKIKEAERGNGCEEAAWMAVPLDIFRCPGEEDPALLGGGGERTPRRQQMLGELISDMAHSTTQGMIGVSLIFIYMAWIIVTALVRIHQGKKEGHH
jgi:hypothetical protein